MSEPGAARTAPALADHHRRVNDVSERICSVEGCAKPTKTRGLCAAHYKRLLRHGDPLGGRTPLGEGRRWLEDMVANGDRSVCWEWPYGHNGVGYGMLTYGDPPRPRYAHRLAVTLDGREMPDGLECRHLCDNPPCCNPDHLVPGTRHDNLVDIVYRGSFGTQKLRPHDALAIRMSSEPQRILAERYGITKSMVWQIRSGMAWKHLLTTRALDGAEIAVDGFTAPDGSTVDDRHQLDVG